MSNDLKFKISHKVTEDNSSNFTIKPLDRGYGITIGNSLRRALLTAVPGAAITNVKIEGAHHEFSTIDGVISTISTNRGTLAAAMNRLDHAIANMQNVATNLSMAKGRIEDADFAAETSNLSRVQVLQQASMAMLAQANASKQNILSLFQ